MPVVIGLDPGSQRTGIGVVEWNLESNQTQIISCDVIELKKATISLRLAELARSLESIFRSIRPDSVAVESAFLGKSVSSAFVLGQARGVCLSVAGHFGCEVAEYAPRTIKKALTGSGAADKLQVQSFLRQVYGVQQASFDACDALAIAICHAQEQQIKSRLIEAGGV